MPFLPPVAWLSRIREEAAAGRRNCGHFVLLALPAWPEARLARLARLTWTG